MSESQEYDVEDLCCYKAAHLLMAVSQAIFVRFPLCVARNKRRLAVVLYWISVVLLFAYTVDKMIANDVFSETKHDNLDLAHFVFIALLIIESIIFTIFAAETYNNRYDDKHNIYMLFVSATHAICKTPRYEYTPSKYKYFDGNHISYITDVVQAYLSIKLLSFIVYSNVFMGIDLSTFKELIILHAAIISLSAVIFALLFYLIGAITFVIIKVTQKLYKECYVKPKAVWRHKKSKNPETGIV